jgi:serine/threonine-protein kinase
LWTRKQVRQTRDWADLLELIRREFKVVRGLRHPNIVRVVELISENDTLYLVMEYLPGRTLQEHLRCHTRPEQPGLSESDGVIVAAALGDALAYAHSKGIVHRDVKPSNVLVGNDGRIVLLDFGIARQRQRGEGRSRVGTESYMAPEQLDGATQTRLVDVYGLGATLYHLLTGQAPASVVQQRRGERLIPPRELAPHLSEHAEAALLRALQHDPTLRTPSTTALADALRGIPVALADFDEQQDRQRSLHFTLLIVLAAVLFAVAGWLVVPR